MPLSDAEREKIRRYVGYLTAGGFTVQAVMARMERLKFEEIVTGRTAAEIVSEAP